MPVKSAKPHGDSLKKFDDSLTTLWAGRTNPIEFSYVSRGGDRTRRKIRVDEVSFDSKGSFYLIGVCFLRSERRTFKVDNISSKLKVGPRRYDFEEWCVEILGISPAYFDAGL